MLILNFSHPVTEQQKIDLAKMIGYEGLFDVKDVRFQLDQETSFQAQIFDLLVELPLTRLDWKDVYIFLPGLSMAAVVIVNELKKITSDVQIVRLKPVAMAVSTQFAVAEVLYLL